MAVANLVQIVSWFAVLVVRFGEEFEPIVQDYCTALYFSAVTFTTTGFGDIEPSTLRGRTIVLLEIVYFIIMLALKLPVAISVLRVEVNPTRKPLANDVQGRTENSGPSGTQSAPREGIV